MALDALHQGVIKVMEYNAMQDMIALLFATLMRPLR